MGHIKVVAIVPAAGRGLRMGSDRPKQFLELAGKPIIIHTLNALAGSDNIIEIIPVVGGDFIDTFKEILSAHPVPKVKEPVHGGEKRQDSVQNGLDTVGREVDIVIVHDAVRPFITVELINKVIESASNTGAAIAAVPPNDTIKVIADRNKMSTPDRRTLRLAQTPQAFKTATIKEAYRQAYKDGFYGTDDASLVERMGLPVEAVEGLHKNIKITTEADLVFAASLKLDTMFPK